MNTTIEIMKQALATHDPDKLFRLVEQAIELAKFEEGRRAIAQGKVAKLEEQVKRQREQIEKLEKTLWG